MSDQLIVQDVRWHSEGIFEIRFERDGFTYTPGDCLALYGPEENESRPYSLASGLNEDLIRFVIRKMPGGVVSTYLSERKAGDQVRCSPPFGWFRPGQSASSDAFVFIATGTGIAPFLSYFRSFPEKPPAQCLYGVRKKDDAVNSEMLRELCDLRLAVSKESVPGAHNGRVTDLLGDIPVDDVTHYYLCGLDDMIDEVTQWLQENGVDITRIHRECFFNSSYSQL